MLKIIRSQENICIGIGTEVVKLKHKTIVLTLLEVKDYKY